MQFKKVLFRAVCPTVFCLLLVLLSSKLFHGAFELTERLSPMGNKIEDYELSDICFAHQFHNLPPDNNIVIVNCMDDSRDQIAGKIERIENDTPCLIALDITFIDPFTEKDNQLKSVFEKYKHHLVFGVEKDQLTYSFYQELRKDTGYHIGILSKESPTETKRHFEPFPDNYPSFAVTAFEMAKKRRNETTSGKLVLAKLHEKQLISYRMPRVRGALYTICTDSIPTTLSLKNKIVLLGGWDSTTIKDKYYTPLGGNISKYWPDMPGVEYHAQILSMLMNDDFIFDIPQHTLLEYMLIFICSLPVIYIISIFKHKCEHIYHFVLEALIFLALTPFFIGISFVLLEYFHLKLEPKPFIISFYFSGIFFELYAPFLKLFKKKK